MTWFVGWRGAGRACAAHGQWAQRSVGSLRAPPALRVLLTRTSSTPPLELAVDGTKRAPVLQTSAPLAL